MGQVKGFNDIIADYLKQRAEEDTLFAPKFANPNKSLFKFCLVTFLSPPVSPFPQLNRT